MVIDGITIPLDFMDNKTLSFGIRALKQEELDELDVHWIILQGKAPVQRVKPSIRRNPALVFTESQPWQVRLGHSPEL